MPCLAALLCSVVLAAYPTALTSAQPHVHLRIDQHGGLSASDLDNVVGEVREIWGTVGVTVTAGRFADPVPAAAMVLSLRLVGARHTDSEGRPVLAWVNVESLSEVVPTAFVSVATVRDVLAAAPYRGKPLNQRPRSLLERFVTRAIGRAVAHELGHYLLARGHDHDGLMRPRYSIDDLMSDSNASFRVSSAAAAVARSALTRHAAQ